MARMTKDAVEQCVERFKAKKDARQQRDNVCQEIAEYIAPEKAVFTKEDTIIGQKNTSKINDGSPIDAKNICKAGINGMLTNAALPWFEAEDEDIAINARDDVRDWYQIVTRIMYNAIQNSNFHTNIDCVYDDAILFGPGCLFIDRGRRTPLSFQSIFIKEIYIDEDIDGWVDTVFRCFKMSARQMAQQWGEVALPRVVKESIKNGDKDRDKSFEILHVTYPRSDIERDGKGNARIDKYNKPYISAYIYVPETELIDEGGYDEFPYAVPRMSRTISGDPYGRGFAWNALPDIKMLNTMERTDIRAHQKNVDPPIVSPDEGISLPMKVGPGGVVYNSNWDTPGSVPVPLHTIDSGALQTFEMKEENIRERIKEFFFNKQFRTQQEGQPRTAQEIIQIASENLKILAPVLGRFQPELIKTTIERSFGIMLRMGMFPQPPEILMRNGRMRIRYLSPIAKAQRLYEAQEITQALGLVAAIGQYKTDILDNISSDKAYNTIQDLYPAIGRISENEDVVAAMRDARAKQEQAMAMQNSIASAVETAKIASEADPRAGILGVLTGEVGIAAQ